MRSLFYILVVTVATTCISYSEPVYYAVQSAEGKDKVEWRVSPSKEDFEKLLEDGTVFDSYTVKREAGKIRQVDRRFATPSGDWILFLNYFYNEEGDLHKIQSEFRTFAGFDAATEEFSPTKCTRELIKDDKGGFKLNKETITDLETGKVVRRSFYSPRVKHWTCTTNLPVSGNYGLCR